MSEGFKPGDVVDYHGFTFRVVQWNYDGNSMHIEHSPNKQAPRKMITHGRLQDIEKECTLLSDDLKAQWNYLYDLLFG